MESYWKSILETAAPKCYKFDPQIIVSSSVVILCSLIIMLIKSVSLDNGEISHIGRWQWKKKNNFISYLKYRKLCHNKNSILKYVFMGNSNRFNGRLIDSLEQNNMIFIKLRDIWRKVNPLLKIFPYFRVIFRYEFSLLQFRNVDIYFEGILRSHGVDGKNANDFESTG